VAQVAVLKYPCCSVPRRARDSEYRVP
jgi:hypothetical protein